MNRSIPCSHGHTTHRRFTSDAKAVPKRARGGLSCSARMGLMTPRWPASIAPSGSFPRELSPEVLALSILAEVVGAYEMLHSHW